jgi:signal peptidase I
VTDVHAVIDGVLRSGNAVSFTATGWSMYPAIRSGEQLVVDPVDANEIRRGEVVLAKLDRGLTAHRVVRIERRGGEVVKIVTRGDNCAEADPPFAAAEFVGRVREPRKSYKIIVRLRHWVRRAVR